MVWVHDVVVQWNGESFRAEGPRNVAIPCDSSQECFYVSTLGTPLGCVGNCIIIRVAHHRLPGLAIYSTPIWLVVICKMQM